MEMRLQFAAALLVLNGCAVNPRFTGSVTDAPDTSHTNSGSASFGPDGKLHIRPAHIVDTMTAEQRATARRAHDAYFAEINARERAALDAMTPSQRHDYICSNLAEDIKAASNLPPVSEEDQTFTDPLALYQSNGCDR